LEKNFIQIYFNYRLFFVSNKFFCWFHVVIIEALSNLHTSDFVINQGNRQEKFQSLVNVKKYTRLV